MNNRPIKILLVEDNLGDARLLREALKDVRFTQFDLSHVVRLDEALGRLRAESFDVVMLDLTLPDSYGIETIKRTYDASIDVPIVVLTGFNDESFAMAAVHEGAQDYLVKDQIQSGILERSIRYAIERHRVELALRRSEKRFRALIEHSSDAIALMDGQGRFLYNGPSTARVLGYSSEELLGTNRLELVHAEDVAPLTQFFLSLVDSPGATSSRQFRSRHKDGTWRWLEAKETNLLDEPAVQAVVSNYRDITERKRAELEIQKQATFAQFNPNPVLELTAAGTLTYYNEAALKMAESMGKSHPSEVLPPDTPKIVHDCLTTEDDRFRLQTSMADRIISWSFFPIRSISLVHAYAVDITERVNLEQQLRQSQKMEAIGQLAAGVAHDFNNILTVIQGHVGLLLRRQPEGPTAESLHQVALVTDRAASLTRQLLMFSRKQVVQRKTVDLNEIIKPMAAMLKRLIGEDIRLVFHYGDNLPSIDADISMFEQIILNLAVNARDAMPQGGQLTISTTAVTWRENEAPPHPSARPGKYLCLSVTDSGCGMDPVTQRRIFEPFFTTKDVGKGTGLGLATVYGIVKQHEGWIEVASQVGQGSTFRIYVQANLNAIEPETPVASRFVSQGSELVLVVEDEPLLRELSVSVLREFGYRVLDASNGREALQIWDQHKGNVDLLITDLIMPGGINGTALAEMLRASKPALKVIFSSGYNSEELAQHMLHGDGISFLPKPYPPAKLAQAVRDSLDR